MKLVELLLSGGLGPDSAAVKELDSIGQLAVSLPATRPSGELDPRRSAELDGSLGIDRPERGAPDAPGDDGARASVPLAETRGGTGRGGS